MIMSPKFLMAALAGLTLIALDAASARAQPEPAQSAPTKPTRQCFSLQQWRGGWRAAPTADALYLGVNTNEVWRLDLQGKSPELLWPDRHLVNIARGDDQVCAPVDLDLSVSDGHGFRTPLFVKSITELTPEEAAALPPKLRP
jgi:hypothetical protein